MANASSRPNDGARQDSVDVSRLNRVLLTGGAGFLGRYLAQALANHGLPVTVLDDLSCSNSTFLCPELQREGIHCVQGSVFDRNLIADLIAKHPTVIHFASVVGVEETISRPIETVENLEGTLNVMRALTQDHIALFGSSADVYGAHSHYYDRGMREDDYFLFENAQINRWVYPHVKALEENLIANSAARSIVIRVFNTYGPAMDFPAPKRVMPHFIDRILAGKPLELSGDGSQRRSFCHVDDMVQGMILALAHAAEQAASFSSCFNLGSPEPIAIRDLAEQVLAGALEIGMIDEPLPILADSFTYSQRFDDSWNRVPDITRATEILKYKPKVSLQEGLKRTLIHYRDLAAAGTIASSTRPGQARAEGTKPIHA